MGRLPRTLYVGLWASSLEGALLLVLGTAGMLYDFRAGAVISTILGGGLCIGSLSLAAIAPRDRR